MQFEEECDKWWEEKGKKMLIPGTPKSIAALFEKMAKEAWFDGYFKKAFDPDKCDECSRVPWSGPRAT
jgi:hypothetical protein